MKKRKRTSNKIESPEMRKSNKTDSENTDKSEDWISVEKKFKWVKQNLPAKIIRDTVGNQEEPINKESKVPNNERIKAYGTTPSNRYVHPRENCVMIFRMMESNEESAEKRYDDDIDSLKLMMNKLLNETEPGVRVVRAIRIGKSINDSSHPRPLKVVLGNKEEAELLLSRGYRLKDTPWAIRPDLTPEEREKQKVAIVELKTRVAQVK